MKLFIFPILLTMLHCIAFNATFFFDFQELPEANAQCLLSDDLNNPADSTAVPNNLKQKLKQSRLYQKIETPGKSRLLYSVIFFIGVIALLRVSDRIIRYADTLLLRVQRRPNNFDGFRFTGNPFILKRPFFAIYHLFLGGCAYRTYLVWPLKYCLSISFIAAIVLRSFPDETMHSLQSLQKYLSNSLLAQISGGLLILLCLTILVLLVIESIRKTKWFFPIRLLIFLTMGTGIFVLMYRLFWFVTGMAILYLLTHLGRDYISRQKIAEDEGYPTENKILEPWPDGATKKYQTQD